ncbi:trypsin-like peptidase domain-containing protein [Flavobacteriaceae bacterium]|nr:trypsin-like peptidase domain-containing protein [Flavobacteriaceae bacterium]
MKKLFCFYMLLLATNISVYAQVNLNGYKYIDISSTASLPYDMRSHFSSELKSKGFGIIGELNTNDTEDAKNNACRVLQLIIDEATESGWGGQAILAVQLKNCNEDVVFTSRATRGNVAYYNKVFPNLIRNKSFKRIMSLRYNSAQTPSIKSDSNKIIENHKLDVTSETAIREYIDDKGADYIEGIWGYSGGVNSSYRLAILKNGYKYEAFILEGSGFWKKGDLKATFEPAATNEIVTVQWTMGDKKSIQNTVGIVKNNSIIEFNLSGEIMLYRIYPKLDQSSEKKQIKKGEWASNGSGLILSTSGYIVTNYHVVEDADELEVEFIIDQEVQKFNAEIVQLDKVNDLAIIKIFDMNFDGLNDLPYNFQNDLADVGTKVFAYGYPMALSVMGKEIKVTDGIISSKTGFDGDITTYQITAPIQGGNSGGPLFDDKGNFLGINSSKLRSDIADNVGYTIKSNYVKNLIQVLPKNIDLPTSNMLESLPLVEQIKEISKYVVLVKVK